MIADEVEYCAYPPPTILLKAMKHRWAKELLTTGLMRFGSLASYREWEDTVLGDPNDGEGLFHMKGRPYSTGSINPIYAWCASLPTITPDRTLLLAEHGEYDCVVRVHNPLILIQRIHDALFAPCNKMNLQYSEVSYNRGAEVDTRTLNSQNFQFNVFQKNPSFAPDMEYRFLLTDSSLRPDPKPYVDLLVGKCSDIMSIQALPKSESN